jgi:hypothetical protein
MKKIFSLLLAGSLMAQGATAQKNETIEGNGKLVTRDIAIKSFSELKASGVYELKLSQGNSESVKIEADENLHDLFLVSNDGDKLVISMKKMNNVNLKTKNKMRVYVTFKNLKDLELSTVGNVASEKSLTFNDLNLENRSVGNVNLAFTANKVDVKNTSVGNVTFTGKAQTAVFKNSGVGNLEAGDFVVQTLNIENTGVGNAEVNAAKELKVKDNMLGKVKNRGAAPVRKMNRVSI